MTEQSADNSYNVNNQRSNAALAQKQDPNANLQIFRLHFDCFEEIFEWLSHYELDILGQTCKRMQKLVGYYFRQNYSALEVRADDDGLYVNDTRNLNWYRGGHKINSFDEEIQKLSICENSIGIEDGIRLFCYVGQHCTNSIKHIQFLNVLLTQVELEWVEKLLKTVLTVCIEDCLIKRQFYEKFPMLCENLINLSVKDCRWNRNVLRRTGNNWIQRKYPKLEHFGWTQASKKGCRIDEFRRFFQLNPQIQSFSTSFHCFWSNREVISTANVQLDKLTIQFDDWTWTPTDINNAYRLLNNMHENGIYTNLNLYTRYFDSQYFTQMTTLKGLYSLHLHEISDRYVIPRLESLKELRIQYINTDLAGLPNQLPNLERIYLKYCESNHYLPFIYNCVKLKEMKIDVVLNREQFECILDMAALNTERGKLERPRKLTIYIDEHIFLATKWKLVETAYSFIEIKLGHSREWSKYIEFY